jgi:hypothetical protein
MINIKSKSLTCKSWCIYKTKHSSNSRNKTVWRLCHGNCVQKDNNNKIFHVLDLRYPFCLYLLFFYWIFEMFWQCGILCRSAFHFPMYFFSFPWEMGIFMHCVSPVYRAENSSVVRSQWTCISVMNHGIMIYIKSEFRM